MPLSVHNVFPLAFLRALKHVFLLSFEVLPQLSGDNLLVGLVDAAQQYIPGLKQLGGEKVLLIQVIEVDVHVVGKLAFSFLLFEFEVPFLLVANFLETDALLQELFLLTVGAYLEQEVVGFLNKPQPETTETKVLETPVIQNLGLDILFQNLFVNLRIVNNIPLVVKPIVSLIMISPEELLFQVFQLLLAGHLIRKLFNKESHVVEELEGPLQIISIPLLDAEQFLQILLQKLQDLGLNK